MNGPSYIDRCTLDISTRFHVSWLLHLAVLPSLATQALRLQSIPGAICTTLRPGRARGIQAEARARQDQGDSLARPTATTSSGVDPFWRRVDWGLSDYGETVVFMRLTSPRYGIYCPCLT